MRSDTAARIACTALPRDGASRCISPRWEASDGRAGRQTPSRRSTYPLAHSSSITFVAAFWSTGLQPRVVVFVLAHAFQGEEADWTPIEDVVHTLMASDDFSRLGQDTRPRLCVRHRSRNFPLARRRCQHTALATG